jgi:hypothetical protein
VRVRQWSSEESGRSPRNQRGGGSPLATKADLTRSLIWHARPDMTEYHPQHAPARVPEDEDERLDVLYQHGLQRVPLQDPELVNFAEIARRMCDTEAAYISVLESEREYVLARAGTWQLHEVDREIAFAAHAVLDSDALVVPDASRDERFKYNKLVYATTNTRFLAAAPLKVMRLGREFRLGCLCVADEGARETFGAGEVLLLETLAEAVVRHIELRPREADLDTSYSRQVMVVKGFVASAGVNLSEENIYKLARCLTIRSVPSKQYLTRKGDPGCCPTLRVVQRREPQRGLRLVLCLQQCDVHHQQGLCRMPCQKSRDRAAEQRHVFRRSRHHEYVQDASSRDLGGGDCSALRADGRRAGPGAVRALCADLGRRVASHPRNPGAVGRFRGDRPAPRHPRCCSAARLGQGAARPPAPYP